MSKVSSYRGSVRNSLNSESHKRSSYVDPLTNAGGLKTTLKSKAARFNYQSAQLKTARIKSAGYRLCLNQYKHLNADSKYKVGVLN